ncbi:Uncharacterised protein [Vibrio cholerae]|nr:Uncharacterised protein [Vibrio cholerae]
MPLIVLFTSDAATLEAFSYGFLPLDSLQLVKTSPAPLSELNMLASVCPFLPKAAKVSFTTP